MVVDKVPPILGKVSAEAQHLPNTEFGEAQQLSDKDFVGAPRLQTHAFLRIVPHIERTKRCIADNISPIADTVLVSFVHNMRRSVVGEWAGLLAGSLAESLAGSLSVVAHCSTSFFLIIC